MCPLKGSCSLHVFQLLNLVAVQSRCCCLASSLQQGFSLQDCSPGVWRCLGDENSLLHLPQRVNSSLAPCSPSCHIWHQNLGIFTGVGLKHPISTYDTTPLLCRQVVQGCTGSHCILADTGWEQDNCGCWCWYPHRDQLPLAWWSPYPISTKDCVESDPLPLSCVLLLKNRSYLGQRPSGFPVPATSIWSCFRIWLLWLKMQLLA